MAYGHVQYTEPTVTQGTQVALRHFGLMHFTLEPWTRGLYTSLFLQDRAVFSGLGAYRCKAPHVARQNAMVFV